ncbi:winged helix-turn-helix transcriptional regulator [Luteibacter aegosomatissinici]|uniref:winged helix-turn-helix transcriptional regulator n=1 Tax=Luteibacter aegosomatissinici TaxID=2911539 RepID=UPI001FF904DA|nr:helix-turn-helix domain-containing protein [Luteibacter aegosomatissinici]UPG92729.1 helix-turn-helix transcriptional regulator [Luteibacter aegosomatissinici]
MSWDEVDESVCPIARSLSVVGDRWTLLILRELSMGSTKFDEIQAQTGMSSFLLSTRLKRLEADGVIERVPYSDRPLRYEYVATDKGKELDPVLLALRGWGMRWGKYRKNEPPAVNMVLKRTGETIDADWVPGKADTPFTFDLCDATVGRKFAAERKGRAAAFRAGRRASASKSE